MEAIRNVKFILWVIISYFSLIYEQNGKLK